LSFKTTIYPPIIGKDAGTGEKPAVLRKISGNGFCAAYPSEKRLCIKTYAVMKKILIIEDDTDLCALLVNLLNREGYETDFAHSGSKGLKKFRESSFDLIMCDYRLGDTEGSKVLQEIKKVNEQAKVIIFTGYDDIKTAVNVMRLGACDFLLKPLIQEDVLKVIGKVFNGETHATTHQYRFSATVSAPVYLRGVGDITKEMYRQAELVAPTDFSVVLYGESGTGKEVIARTIHDLSNRKDKPFVAVDCGTLSKELASSELFGYVKGSFTGAATDKEGNFEIANGGTLFLDEVANLSYDIQASLLRAIQEKKIRRVGGDKEIPTDVRIIVASNENLQSAYLNGKFREDLYHRFNEFSIIIPPLRERKEDIPLFAGHFLAQCNAELGKGIIGFDKDVIDLFLQYEWPGNLREMRNVIRKAALLCMSSTINSRGIPSELRTTSSKLQLNGATGQLKGELKGNLRSAAFMAEYQIILSALQKVNFNKSKAAELLNIDRKTLYNKLKHYELMH
jgi:two-component system response regulator HydG